ncbi:hypothetical protein PG988_006737 [Apiospora saccharicola]
MSVRDQTREMMQRAGEEMFNNELFSDAKVTVDDTTWPVHKSILCPRSEYFKKAFTGPFSEATTNHLTIKGHTAVAVRYVLYYLYTGEKGTMLANSEDIFTIRQAVDAFVAADYFDIKPLKEEAIWLLDQNLESVQDYNSEGPLLDDNELGYIFHAARLAYSSGPNLEALRKPIERFMADTDFLLTKDKLFMQELNKVPEFAMALIQVMSSPENEKSMLACCRAIPEQCIGCISHADEFAETFLYARPSHDPDNPRVLVGTCTECFKQQQNMHKYIEEKFRSSRQETRNGININLQ